MEWIREKPSESGFYWFSGSDPEVGVSVDEIVFVFDGTIEMVGTDSVFEIDHVDGLWYGPIKPPELPDH